MGSSSARVQLQLINGNGVTEQIASIMYVDMKNEDAFPVSLCARYSVTRLVKLSESIFAQSKELPSVTRNIRGTHKSNKCEVSSLSYNLHVIMATYLCYGSKEAIEYMPWLSTLNFFVFKTQSFIKLGMVLSYYSHSFSLNSSKNSTPYV
jgi:hypothetical protein